MADPLQFDKKNNVATITLNRPDSFNAFNEPLSDAFKDALKSCKKDDEIRAVVVTGAGKAFSAGQDLKDIADQEDRSLSDSLYNRYNPIIRNMRKLPKPIIGRVNGVAAGAGCSLAFACDLLVASKKAKFIEVFINVGLALDSGSSFFLPRLVGMKKAFELATLGSEVKAEEAHELGIVNKVVEHDKLDDAVQEWTDYFAQAPTKAVGLIKKQLNKSFNADLKEMLQYEAYCQEIAGRTEDYKEGVDAFVEKRKPEFKGK